MCNGFPLLDNLKHQDPAHVLILDFCVQIFTLRILAQKVTLQLFFSKAKKYSIREHWWNPQMNSSVHYLVSYWRTDDPEAHSVFGVFTGVVWRCDDSIWLCESISTIHWGVKEKTREWHIRKSILAIEVSMLIVFFLQAKKKCDTMKIYCWNILFLSLLFVLAALLKELKP